MRFRRIELTRFGPFEDKVLEFDDAAPLTVIYGPNEAGKSSLLTALGDLLFGVPHQAPYATFRHDSRRLEMSAEIEATIDGATRRLAFRRLKRQKGDLTDPDGAALTPGALEPFLGSADRTAFEQLFGLDAGRLREHGRQLLEDGGALGESLLGAGALLGDFSARRRALDAAAEKIFAPKKAQHRRFYAALDAWTDAKKALREKALTRGALKKADDALESAAAARRTAEAALEALERTRARDKRAIAAAEILPTLDARRAELSALGPAPEAALIDAAGDALETLRQAREAAEAGARRAQKAEAALAAEPGPGPALGQAAAIEAAAELAAAAAAAARARKTHAAEAAELTARKTRLAARLGVDAAELDAAAPTDAERESAARALKRRSEAGRAALAARRSLDAARAASPRDGATARPGDLAAARAARDAGWADLKAALAAGDRPAAARIDAHDAMIRLADVAADSRIAAADEIAAVDAAAATLAEREAALDAAVAALDAATTELAPFAKRLLRDDFSPTEDDLEPAIEAALEAWRAAEPLFAAEAALARRAVELNEGGATLDEAAAALAEALGEPPPSHPAQDVRRWAAALKDARAAQERLRARAAQLREETAALEEARRRQETASDAAATLAARLGLSDPSDLAGEIGRARRVAQAAEKLRAAEAQLRAAADGRSEETLRGELEVTDLDEAAARLAAGDARWREAKAANDQAVAAEATARSARAALESDRGAAEAARAADDAAAAMALAAEEWLALRAASLVLGEAAKRHRERTANPVLTAASRLFSALTLGAFAELGVETDEKGEERIVAVRAKAGAAPGERVRVENLSEGARDQLFLALRLAAIERWAEDRATPPFIADDLFASFDDDRLAAGLATLCAARVGDQRLTLTHHRHVVDIAQARLGDRVQVIEL